MSPTRITQSVLDAAIEAQRKDKYLRLTKVNRDASRQKFIRETLALKKGKIDSATLDRATLHYGDAMVRLFAEYVGMNETPEIQASVKAIAEDFIAGKIVIPKANTNG